METRVLIIMASVVLTDGKLWKVVLGRIKSRGTRQDPGTHRPFRSASVERHGVTPDGALFHLTGSGVRRGGYVTKPEFWKRGCKGIPPHTA
jgi:hypothetical protein